MSYMRGSPYVYGCAMDKRGTLGISIDGHNIPMKVFDELVAMRWAELTNPQQKRACERAVKKYSGNTGCIALCKLLNRFGFNESLKQFMNGTRMRINRISHDKKPSTS